MGDGGVVIGVQCAGSDVAGDADVTISRSVRLRARPFACEGVADMLFKSGHLRLFVRLAALFAASALTVQLAAPAVVAAPAPDEGDEVADAFLSRLLDEINVRRDAVGTQRLAYVPASANAALDGFLAETVPAMAWPSPCMHHLVDGAFSWEYVNAAGFDGEALGEVLACPGPEPYWTPDRAAETWWGSPVHHGVLYADPDASAIACSAYGVQGGGNNMKNKSRNSRAADAASAVLCVTFRG
jgi:hypothetical protein